MPDEPIDDPTRESRWRPLFRLLRSMEAQIDQVYAASGLPEVSARHVLPLVRLSHVGPLTIRDLAAECEVTHSAMSQTVAAMTRLGFVEATTDPGDRRARRVALSDLGRRVVALGEAEWRATEAAVAQLEGETSVALSAVVAEIEEALARRSFLERIQEHLEEPPPADRERP